MNKNREPVSATDRAVDPDDPREAREPQAKKFKLTLSAWALIVTNFIPVLGGLFLGWDIRVVLIVYWAENVVVGFYNVLKMASIKSDEPVSLKLLLIPFFSFHFGIFCTVHGVFIFSFLTSALFGGDVIGLESDSIRPASDWPFPLQVFGLLIGVIGSIWSTFGWSAMIPILGLLFSHGISFVQNYIGKGEFKTSSVMLQMFKPYGRIVIMHIAIILAAVPVFLLGSPLPLLILLILFKTFVDVVFHQLSHTSGGKHLLRSWIQQKIEKLKAKVDQKGGR